MKLAIGMRPYAGPWGGGNRFIASLTEAAAAAGHAVVFDLQDSDIDLILLVDPRVRSANVAFGAGAIQRYLAQNPRAVVVHRINECDERKGTKTMNLRLVMANQVADATAFVGEWLTRLPVWREHLRAPWFVVRNGADTSIFNRNGFRPWTGDGPLKLVTHHWGNHQMKGFDVYSKIDDLMESPTWRGKIELTYVGRLPEGFQFRNAQFVKALDGAALATELRSHHAYVTGSINEPGGNHQNEGALCGLPLLYRNSGCLPEYCEGFGIRYDGPADLEGALRNLITEYPELVQRMPSYPHTARKMTEEWLALFANLVARRDDLAAARRPWRRPLWRLANMLPL